jgi:hypothetical protein
VSGTGTFGGSPAAVFSFVAGHKLQSGVAVLHGDTAFDAGALQLRSASLLSLTVSGATVQLAGYGTINGRGNYGFMVIAKDAAVSGGPAADTFQITIWDPASGLAIYDSGPDRGVGDGKIVIR